MKLKAMLRLNSYITFTKADGREFYFDFVNKVDQDESWDDATKTAKITVPRKIDWQGQNLFVGENAILKRGDRVKIEIGYFPNLRNVFEGYISKVGSNIPVVVQCEDMMFTLKNTNVTKTLKAPTLRQLLTAILPAGTPFDCIDVTLGDFRMTNASVTQILQELKTGYGLYYNIRNGSLYVGFASRAEISRTENFAFEETIINENDLEWQNADDISLKVKAISMNKDNTKTEVEVGDADGAQRTFYQYNATEAALKTFATLKLEETKYTGYVGNVETFGEPFVQQGDIAALQSKKLPERDGNYLIRDVRRNFGVGIGNRQILGIDQRV